MSSSRATPVRLRLLIARLLASFAVLLQCLSPVLAQSMPMMSAPAPAAAMASHPAHCPHHPAAKQAATQTAPANHGQGLCCGSSHCVCAVSVAAVNEIQGLSLQGIDHPSPPWQSPATAPAFETERLRPPNRLRIA